MGAHLRGVAVGCDDHRRSRSLRGTRVAAISCSLIKSAKLSGTEPATAIRAATRRAVESPGTITLPSTLHDVVETEPTPLGGKSPMRWVSRNSTSLKGSTGPRTTDSQECSRLESSEHIALITGASSGIGLEMARILAARGYDLVLVSRNAARLEARAQTIASETDAKVQTLAVDLAESGSARRVFHFTAEQGLEIDVLINNAGVGLFGEHVSLNLDASQAMLQLNVTSVCDLCLLYGQEMRARGRGRILNVASTAAYQPTPYFAAYGASKSFVLNFSEALAKELESEGVTVSCLSPGPTDTGFFHAMDERGVHNGHFDKRGRHDARKVAEMGIELMLAGKLSKIVGILNALRSFSGRLAPRSVVASISKKLMTPKQGGVVWQPSKESADITPGARR